MLLPRWRIFGWWWPMRRVISFLKAGWARLGAGVAAFLALLPLLNLTGAKGDLASEEVAMIVTAMAGFFTPGRLIIDSQHGGPLRLPSTRADSAILAR